MKKMVLILFSLICMFYSCRVFAEGEVIVKSITPVYDSDSAVSVDNTKVIFNDKDQEVKYNVVLENKSNKDLAIENINLSNVSEDFLIYEISDLKKTDVIKANSSKEITVSFSTVVKEHWGRNFNDELTANIKFTDNVLNPNTSSQEIMLLLILTIALIAMLIIFKNKKISRYVVFIIIFGSFVSVIKAKTITEVLLKFNVSYESQTLMKKTNCRDLGSDGVGCVGDYSSYIFDIKGFYIENELNEPDNYIEKYDMSEEQNGSVVAYLVPNADDEYFYDLYLQGNGIIYLNEYSVGLFARMFYLDFIDNIEGIDTSNVVDMGQMFYGTGSSSEIFTINLDSFNTSNVYNMSGMFSGTGYSSLTFALDVSSFDTSNVTDMSEMFRETGYNSHAFTLNLGENFDTSNVIDMAAMFRETGYSNSVFTLDLGDKFNTSKVTSMEQMFWRTGYNSTIFTLDVSDFDTSHVNYMSKMFEETGKNSTKLNLEITIKNQYINNYSKMFKDVALLEGSKITVNYTSETSDLVDQMLLTKTDGANVVKGVLVD